MWIEKRIFPKKKTYHQWPHCKRKKEFIYKNPQSILANQHFQHVQHTVNSVLGNYKYLKKKKDCLEDEGGW